MIAIMQMQRRGMAEAGARTPKKLAVARERNGNCGQVHVTAERIGQRNGWQMINDGQRMSDARR